MELARRFGGAYLAGRRPTIAIARKTIVDAEPDLFGPPPLAAAPEGFRYQPDLLTPDEEARLIDAIAPLPFKPFEFRGYLGNRRTISFGFRYDYTARRVLDAAPAPDALVDLRARAAAFAARPADDFVQTLVSEYAPGAGIGWHLDRPQFGDVVGISLLAPCAMRFRRKNGASWDRASVPLAPRSAYLFSGPARDAWQHSITPMTTLRYSVTFRTLRAP